MELFLEHFELFRAILKCLKYLEHSEVFWEFLEKPETIFGNFLVNIFLEHFKLFWNNSEIFTEFLEKPETFFRNTH